MLRGSVIITKYDKGKSLACRLQYLLACQPSLSLDFLIFSK